jgi:hypothetical protein
MSEVIQIAVISTTSRLLDKIEKDSSLTRIAILKSKDLIKKAWFIIK